MRNIRKRFLANIAHRKQRICDAYCPSLIFDGRGRWINDSHWKAFSQGRMHHFHDGLNVKC